MSQKIITFGERFNLSISAFKKEQKEYESLLKQFSIEYETEKCKNPEMFRFILYDISLKKLNTTFLTKLNNLQNQTS